MSVENSKLMMLVHPEGKEEEFRQENAEGFSYPGNAWNG